MPDHHAQAVTAGFVEQVEARRRVQADGVDAERCHQPEVLRDPGGWRELIAVRVRREGAVGHALHEETGVPFAEELAVAADAGRRRGRRPPGNRRSRLERDVHRI